MQAVSTKTHHGDSEAGSYRPLQQLVLGLGAEIVGRRVVICANQWYLVDVRHPTGTSLTLVIDQYAKSLISHGVTCQLSANASTVTNLRSVSRDKQKPGAFSSP